MSRSSTGSFTMLAAMLAGALVAACTGLSGFKLGSTGSPTALNPGNPGTGNPGTGGGGTAGSCCVNGAAYTCPDASALDRCAGAFGRCMTSCALGSDSGCADRCVAEHPPDPSGCQRDVSAGASCK
jgi:hypothetical protein